MKAVSAVRTDDNASGINSSRSILKKGDPPDPGFLDEIFIGYSKPSILEMESILDTELGKEAKLIHDDVEGPGTVCRPIWPSYTASLPTRERAANISPLDYLEALELRRDENLEIVMPIKYRTRFRVGRGGRLFGDKIPVRPINSFKHDIVL